MKLLWEDRAWSDYLYWQTQDKKTLKRINALIKDIQRSPYQGIGKPEPLRGNLSGWGGGAAALTKPIALFTMSRERSFILSPAWATMTIEKGRAGYELG